MWQSTRLTPEQYGSQYLTYFKVIRFTTCIDGHRVFSIPLVPSNIVMSSQHHKWSTVQVRNFVILLVKLKFQGIQPNPSKPLVTVMSINKCINFETSNSYCWCTWLQWELTLSLDANATACETFPCFSSSFMSISNSHSINSLFFIMYE